MLRAAVAFLREDSALALRELETVEAIHSRGGGVAPIWWTPNEARDELAWRCSWPRRRRRQRRNRSDPESVREPRIGAAPSGALNSARSWDLAKRLNGVRPLLLLQLQQRGTDTQRRNRRGLCTQDARAKGDVPPAALAEQLHFFSGPSAFRPVSQRDFA